MTTKETFDFVKSHLPKPYYQDDYTALYHGDSMELVKLLPTSYVKMVATDPPYGILYKSGQRIITELDVIANDHELHLPFDELWRVTRSDGSMFIFYSWKVPMFRKVSVPMSVGEAKWTYTTLERDDRIRNEIIWYKGGGGMGDLKGDFANEYETIAFCPKENFVIHGDKRPTNVILDIPKVGTKRVHLTQKPVRLMDRIIRWGTNVGDIVLEPFAGSGTTGLACQKASRYCIMFELNERNCKIIRNRLSQMELDFGGGSEKLTAVDDYIQEDMFGEPDDIGSTETTG